MKQPIQLSLFDWVKSKIKSEYLPFYAELLSQHLKKPLSTPRNFCSVVGVGDKILYRWCKRFPDFRKVWMSYVPRRRKVYV